MTPSTDQRPRLGEPVPTAVFVVFVAVIALVLFRSAMFVFKPGLDFDSDQATFGLMGKHLAEGRAFPLFIYGQNYLLAVEAWLAAPVFMLFGVSVATLKLPLLVINLVVGILIVALVRREVGLPPVVALVVSLPFVLAPPEASTTMLKTLGGTVEPLLYVLLLWVTRRRPLWFGLVAGIGVLQREFTAYGVAAVLLVDAATGALRQKAVWTGYLRALRVVAEVWLVVQFLKPLASGSGPGTTGAQLLPGVEADNFVNALHRTCFDVRVALAGLRGLVTLHWPRLFGIEMRPLTAFGLVGDSVQGVPGAAWFFGPAVLLMLIGAVASAWTDAGSWKRYQFAVYLMVVGALSAGMLALGRCGMVETLRYDLLSILGAVGFLTWFFTVERHLWMRRAAVTTLLVWAAISVVGHARIWTEYESLHPPVADKVLIMRNLEARGIRYASADYWLAYYITFMANERIIIDATDFRRIAAYEPIVSAHRAESVRISRTRCDAGKLIIEGVYFCQPF
ncbi:MAG TPA: hypothetical protein VNZ26_17015 [Vicinamibacterales bacterium]|nr:hypothetical protein [Vicinamibacterales bacterium]